MIEPVAKGESGGDVLQHVRNYTGQICGEIRWESKRTKAWFDGWLTQLKGDQRAAHAELAIIVSQTLPKDVTHFDQMDGIWVSSLGCILPVTNALRVGLIKLARVRRSSDGLETKAQQMYAYLTGPRFKHRVECIAEKFTRLRKDLNAERKWMTKQWAKRDCELLTVLEATSGTYGDLQGIAGQSLQEIEARRTDGVRVKQLNPECLESDLKCCSSPMHHSSVRAKQRSNLHPATHSHDAGRNGQDTAACCLPCPDACRCVLDHQRVPGMPAE